MGGDSEAQRPANPPGSPKAAAGPHTPVPLPLVPTRAVDQRQARGGWGLVPEDTRGADIRKPVCLAES